MGSIIVHDKDDVFDCYTCTNSKNWKAQGRDDNYIFDRLKRKLINKGCTSDAKKPVFRLTDGEKIYRCPRAISEEYHSLYAYSLVASIRDNIYSFERSKVSWKWAQVIQCVRAELASEARNQQRSINRNNK